MSNVNNSYTISEVADKLDLAPKTLRRWEDAGKFKADRTVGGQRRYSMEDLQILDAIKHGTIESSSDLLTLEQAAGMFGVTPQTMVRWEDEGKIHPFITAGNTYYPKTRILEKIEDLKAHYNDEPLTYSPPHQVSSNPTPNFPSNPSPNISQTTAFNDPITTHTETSQPPLKKPLSASQFDHNTPTEPTLSAIPKNEPTPIKETTSTSPHQPTQQKPETPTQTTKKPPEKNSLTPLKPPASKPSDNPTLPNRFIFLSVVINIIVTIAALAGYHIMVGQQSPPTNTGQVQGATQQINPLDKTLQSILDVTGNFNTPGNITTKNNLIVGKSLQFSPSTATTGASPGTLYYDSASETLKLFTQGAWYNIPSSASALTLDEGTTTYSGKSTLEQGTTEATVSDPSITNASHITITFLSDYSPAEKYWITQESGEFTLNTDIAPSQDSDFNYIIITPEGADEQIGPTIEEEPEPEPEPEPEEATTPAELP